MENKNCDYSFAFEITLDDGRIFTFDSVDNEYELLVKEPFFMVKEDEEIIAMFNMNNVVSVIFD